MLTADAKGLVAALKVKGALCAAEPGTSLQRRGGSWCSHLLVLVWGSLTHWGLADRVYVLPWTPALAWD